MSFPRVIITPSLSLIRILGLKTHVSKLICAEDTTYMRLTLIRDRTRTAKKHDTEP